MSNPTPPHPTRQQLDELEALMQRMLALPVNQLEGEAGEGVDVALPTLPSIHVPPEWESSETAPHLLEMPREPETPEPAALPATLAATPAPEPTAAPNAREELLGLGPWPTLRNNKSAADVNGGLAAANVLVVDRATPQGRTWSVPGRRRRPGPWLRSLVWTNRAFDRVTAQLGPPGRWLRGPRGRAWLGGTGLLCLATALAWFVLGWIGWTR